MKKHIVINLTVESMFWGNWSGVNIDASIQKYANAVMAQVSSRYAEANVRVTVFQDESAPEYPPRKTLTLFGYVYPESEYVSAKVTQIMSDLWNDRSAWIVNT